MGGRMWRRALTPVHSEGSLPTVLRDRPVRHGRQWRLVPHNFVLLSAFIGSVLLPISRMLPPSATLIWPLTEEDASFLPDHISRADWLFNALREMPDCLLVKELSD
ncbi:Hypothetical predicted protein [Podarcis lilfordi]|uniref:Uncharacterized protein n=1 Tax=Podarcis lilfordi TaxID=74358 RepID=A0AA35PHK8_9SAUR|nr:Hypothetical predicted protein [Podarcis lilfordi]